MTAYPISTPPSGKSKSVAASNRISSNFLSNREDAYRLFLNFSDPASQESKNAGESVITLGSLKTRVTNHVNSNRAEDDQLSAGGQGLALADLNFLNQNYGDGFFRAVDASIAGTNYYVGEARLWPWSVDNYCATLLNQLDADKNGNVDFSEFYVFITRYPGPYGSK